MKYFAVLCCTVEKKVTDIVMVADVILYRCVGLVLMCSTVFFLHLACLNCACSHVQPATFLASYPLKVKAKHILHDCSLIVPCGLSCTPVQCVLCAWCADAVCVCVCVYACVCVHVWN